MGVKYECKKCDRIFVSKTDYTRHTQRKNPCDSNKDIKIYEDKHVKVDISEQLLNKMNEIVESNKQMSESNKQMSEANKQMSEEIKLLKDKISKIEDVKKINNNIVIDNSDNSSHNNIKNVNLQQNITINMVPHGKEDLSFLTEDQKKQILNKGLLSINEYVKMVHCNDKIPEYKNIYISNRKNMNGSLMIFGDERWNLADKSCIDNLVDKGIDFVEEQYEELTEKKALPQYVIKKVDKFKTHIEVDPDAKKAKICKDIKRMLYNNRPL
jgi:hypothetical protein